MSTARTPLDRRVRCFGPSILSLECVRNSSHGFGRTKDKGNDGTSLAEHWVFGSSSPSRTVCALDGSVLGLSGSRRTHRTVHRHAWNHGRSSPPVVASFVLGVSARPCPPHARQLCRPPRVDLPLGARPSTPPPLQRHRQGPAQHSPRILLRPHGVAVGDESETNRPPRPRRPQDGRRGDASKTVVSGSVAHLLLCSSDSLWNVVGPQSMECLFALWSVALGPPSSCNLVCQQRRPYVGSAPIQGHSARRKHVYIGRGCGRRVAQLPPHVPLRLSSQRGWTLESDHMVYRRPRVLRARLEPEDRVRRVFLRPVLPP